MCESGGEMQFFQSPLFVALQAGFERLLEGVKSDEFQFIVNGECLKSTVFEAMLISPKIHENFRFCPGCCIFYMNDESITTKDLSCFIDFVHSHVL
jgi:hypothetical protein